MRSILTIKPANGGKTFTVETNNLSYDDGVYYANGASWPEEIVDSINEFRLTESEGSFSEDIYSDTFAERYGL